MTKQSYPDSLPYLSGRPFSAGSDIHCPPKGPGWKFESMAFTWSLRTPNRNSDEKVMTFRSLRSHMTKQSYLDSLPYLPGWPFPSF